MNKNYIFFVVLFLGQLLNAQTPAWSWAKSIASTSDDFSQVVRTDANQNVYIAGGFEGPSMTLDSITLTNSAIGTRDIFIAKYDQTGKIIWAKRAGGVLSEYFASMHVDINGDIYITGGFASPTIEFGTTTLTNLGKSDVFVAKYDSNGNVLWAKGYGGEGYDTGENISTDNAGNVLLTGYYAGPSISFDSISLECDTVHCDVFIVKCDASGNVLWAQKGNGADADFGKGIAADSNGNIFVTGYFYSPSITFGNTTLSNTGSSMITSNAFVLKYDAAGNLLWAKAAKGTGSKLVKQLEIEKNGNTVVTGTFGPGSFSFGSITLTNSGSRNDIFISKFDASGNTLWTNSAGGLENEEVNGICLDNAGNVYLTGVFFSATAKFDTIILTNAGSIDMYLAKYNAAGKAVWAKSTTAATSSAYGFAITADDQGVIYETGIFKSNISLGINKLTSLGGFDGFIAKLCDIPLVISASGPTAFCVGGNVTLDAGSGYSKYLWSTGDTTKSINVSNSGNYIVTVTNQLGCSVSSSQTVTAVSTPKAILPSDVSYCEGTVIPSFKFSSVPANASFSWTNSNPAIGLPASGSGDLPSFKAIATDSATSPDFATITVTPIFTGCTFPADSFKIRIDPRSDASFYYLNSTFCQSEANPKPILADPFGYFVPIKGLVFADSETGEIDLFASTAGTYNVERIRNSNCPDTSFFTITIIPIARVDAGFDAVICEGNPYTLISSNWGSTASILWKTSGSGKFSDSTRVSPIYTPSLADIAAGKVTLTVEVGPLNGGCNNGARDTIVLTIIKCKNASGETTFYKAYQNIGEAGSVRQTSDGGYIFTSRTNNCSIASGSGCYLIKTDVNGDTIWAKSYGTNANGAQYTRNHVQQTKDGGYILSTTIYTTNDPGIIVVIKTDSVGNKLWSKQYGGTKYDEVNSISLAGDDGYLICGSTKSFGAGMSDIYVLKIDTAGSILWTRIYGSKDDETGGSIKETTDGGFILAGKRYNSIYQGIYLSKLDKNGNATWTKLFRPANSVHIEADKEVIQTVDGGYAIITTTSIKIGGSNTSDPYACLIKTNSNGDELWAKVYGIRDHAMYATNICETFDGGYAFSGYVFDTWTYPYISRTNSTGDISFQKIYGVSNPTSSIGMNSIIQTRDGGFACVGKMDVVGPSGYGIIKTDGSGSAGCYTSSYFTSKFSIKLVVDTITSQVSSEGIAEDRPYVVCSGSQFVNVCTDAATVWPGDADHNAVADNFDLLNIGLYYGQKGTARSTINNTWRAFPSTNWGIKQFNGHDIKHVDCNGDGTINADDTIAIQLNFGLTHASPPDPFVVQYNAPDFYFITTNQTFNSGDIVNTEVWLGSTNAPITNLYGLAFNIHYNSSVLQSGTGSFTYSNNTLGIGGIDAIKMVKMDASTNTIYCGETRIDHKNAPVYGKLGEFKFQLKNSLPPDTKIVFSISNYKANDATGNPLVFNLKTDTIVINPTVGIKEINNDLSIMVSPNPFNSYTAISFNKELKNATVKIIDMIGQEVKVIPFSGDKLVIEKGELKSGIYFIQVELANTIFINKKIVIQ